MPAGKSKPEVHQCNQQGRIAKMETKLNEVYNIVKGNGQKGIHELTIRLDQKYDLLNENVTNIATSISSIAKNQSEIKIEKDIKKLYEELQEKKKMDKRWMITTIITLSLGIAGLLTKILLF